MELPTTAILGERHFERAPSAYLITDLHGCILDANRAATELFSTDAGALTGVMLQTLVHPHDRRMFCSQLEETSKRLSPWAAMDMRFSAHGRKPFDALINVALECDEQGAAIALRWIIHDISERVSRELAVAQQRDRFEDLAKRRNAELEAALQRLRQAERLACLGALMHGFGHDVANLTLPMLWRLDTAAAQAQPDSIGQDIEALRKSVVKLRELAIGLSLLSRDGDEIPNFSCATSINQWWEQARPALQKALPAHVRLQSELPEALPCVTMFAHQLTLAIRHLVVNSAESIIGASGVVRVWARAADDQRTIHLGVTDNGRGMTQDVREHALQPFFTTKKPGPTTGLGLPTVNWIVQAAGGRLDLDSAPECGTTVVLTLPIADESTDPAAEHQRTACITVQDARIASFAAALLKTASFEIVMDAPAAAGQEVLWIHDPAVHGPDRIRNFVSDQPGRRAIVIGPCSDEWNQPGIEVVDGSQRAIHKALRKAVIELT